MGNCAERPEEGIEIDGQPFKNEDRRTFALQEYRQTLKRQDFRRSLLEDEKIERQMLEKLHIYKQGHLLDHHRLINNDQAAKINLLEDIGVIDFATIDFLHYNFFKRNPDDPLCLMLNKNKGKLHEAKALLYPDYSLRTMLPTPQELIYIKGLKKISEGKVAVVILASDYFIDGANIVNISTQPLPIPSKKTMLRILIEKIRFISNKAIEEFGRNCKDDRDPIPVYIMTSEAKNDEIFDEFESEDFYGQNCTFLFPQKDLPAFSENGSILLKAKDRIGLYPNGSGGFLEGFHKYKVLTSM